MKRIVGSITLEFTTAEAFHYMLDWVDRKWNPEMHMRLGFPGDQKPIAETKNNSKRREKAK